MNIDERKLPPRDRRDRTGRRVGSDPETRHDRAMALARECEASGDKVEAERFYQQADHYRRLLNNRAA